MDFLEGISFDAIAIQRSLFLAVFFSWSAYIVLKRRVFSLMSLFYLGILFYAIFIWLYPVALRHRFQDEAYLPDRFQNLFNCHFLYRHCVYSNGDNGQIRS